LGYGAMGSAVANQLAANVLHLDEFNDEILWYVRDEEFGGFSLLDEVKRTRSNPKYAPDVKLLKNVVICGSLEDVAVASDVLILIVSARHVLHVLKTIRGHMKQDVLFVSLSKGLIDYQSPAHSFDLISEVVLRELGIGTVVVSGAYNARGLLKGHFAEITVGTPNEADGAIVKRLLSCDSLELTWTDDACTVEVCGALKNILAVASGIMDGLGYGANTKSAIIRLGLYEIGQYRRFLYGKFPYNPSTLLQSCGASELFLCILHKSDEVPKTGDDFDFFNLILGRMLTEKKYSKMNSTSIENSLHHDLVASGPDAARKVNSELRRLQACELYPLFTAVHLICERVVPPEILINMLQYHPAHE